MSNTSSQRQRSILQSFKNTTNKGDDGDWEWSIFIRWSWVTMQPSTKGAHNEPHPNMENLEQHWKGQILELKQTTNGKNLVQVQHVYKVAKLKLLEDQS